DLVDVTPPPRLPRLERLDDRVLRAVVVLRRVLVLRRIAAADVAAAQAAAEVHPRVARLQALLAALGGARRGPTCRGSPPARTSTGRNRAASVPDRRPSRPRRSPDRTRPSARCNTRLRGRRRCRGSPRAPATR